ncbi:coiled-coil domain-containing protein 89-like [Strongylocentrotus purpuratus]|uniref:Coiled-coil domain-containing protein 89 n=1 Tax=Strongylocentrotus purpuratus TaxID=7668 RepID=A0A7M7T181_STRPU|nr:coiled-coil domain-containing protein 89-like [Strongylocentrotus purpuratus]
MAGTRSPKELKNMISASKQDVEVMNASLDKLKRLTHEDKTEAAMLRSRIDEQGQLICILKQRADESLLKAQTLDRINRELEKFREHAQEMLEGEIKKFNMVDRRFQELAENHEEMIRFKDEYKRQNEILRTENQRLREDNGNLFSGAIEERDQKIKEQQKDLKLLKGQSRDMERRCSLLQEEMTEKERQHIEIAKSLEKELKSAKNQMKEVLAQLKQERDSKMATDSSNTMRLEKLSRERQEFLDLSMQRGKLIQDKQREIKQMVDKVKEAEKALHKMEEKFEREAALVSTNLQVIRLKDQRDEAEKDLSGLKMEYAAYKKHTANLLAKEKTLNSKLRNLCS